VTGSPVISRVVGGGANFAWLSKSADLGAVRQEGGTTWVDPMACALYWYRRLVRLGQVTQPKSHMSIRGVLG